MHLETRQIAAAFEIKGKTKGRSNAHCRHMQRLVTGEIQMLKVVLYLVCRNNRTSKAS
jgi:hypothetical protein